MMGGPVPSVGSRFIAPKDGATEPPNGVSAHPGCDRCRSACRAGKQASDRLIVGGKRFAGC